MDPHAGAARKLARQATKGTAIYSPGTDARAQREPRPIPRKAKRTAAIFSAIVMAVAALPAVLELSGVLVNIGPWLSLLITVPTTLIVIAMMGFLRDGLTANLISAAAILFGLSMSYSIETGTRTLQEAMLFRAIAPVIGAVVLGFFWLSLRTHLRDLHYLIDQGESLQDIMMRYQQANVIRKAGGKPAITEEGKVVDANEITGRKGFRQRPQKSAKQQGEKKKRKKPKVR